MAERRSLIVGAGSIPRRPAPDGAALGPTAENVASDSAEAAVRGATIRSLMERSHEMKKSPADAARP
jgi:hypothetical protein